MSKITCQNSKHDFKEIILLCLNRNCKQSRACSQCIEQSHINHIHDCFKFFEMKFILTNEVYKISKLTNIQNHKIQAHIEQYNKLLNHALSIYQQFRPNQQQFEFIINITKLCYNNTIQNQLMSFILQNLIGESEDKTIDIINSFNKAYSQNSIEYIQKRLEQKGKRLLELKQLKEAIIFYQQAYQLNYNEKSFIINYCRCLKLNKNILEAIKLMNNHRQFFDLDDQGTFFQTFKTTWKKTVNLIQIFVLNNPTHIIILQNVLIFYQIWNSLIFVTNILIMYYKKSHKMKMLLQLKVIYEIISIVNALLREGQLGRAKEFIDFGDKKYPKLYIIPKYICLMNDQQFFSSYKQTLCNSFDKSFIKSQQYEITESTYYSSNVYDKQTSNIQSKSIEQQFTNLLQSQIKLPFNNKVPKFFQMLDEYQKQNYYKVLDLLDQLLSVVPIFRVLYALKSKVYFDLQNHGFNLKFAKIAMYLGKEISFYTRFYAFSLIFNYEVEKAIEVLEKSSHKNDYKVLMLKGNIYYEQNQYPQALKCFEQLLELQQNDNETIRAIIQLINQQNNVSRNSDDGKELQQSHYKKDIIQSQVQCKSNSEISKKGNSQISEIDATAHLRIGLEFDIGEILNMIPKQEIGMLYSID